MFSSLGQALGINSTFFVQFLVFMALYPVLSRMLFRPYFRLHEKREEQTRGRMTKADKWQKEEQALKTQYEQSARQIHLRFEEMYRKESKKLKQNLLEDEEKKQTALRQEYKQKTHELLQEVKEKEQSLYSEAEALSDLACQRLLSS